jgi:hypothetical protein
MTSLSESVRATARVAIEPELGPSSTPPPAAPWNGKSIMVRHHANGTVSASCRGLLAVGANEIAALQELALMIKEADRASKGDVDLGPPITERAVARGTRGEAGSRPG